MSDAVNHPSHYEKYDKNGKVRPEAIDLLALFTKDLVGIAALEMGQFKYLYRAGAKGEMGYAPNEKAAQDVGKLIWYMNDFIRHAKKADERENAWYLPKGFCRFNYFLDEDDEYTICHEFSCDKPEPIRQLVFDTMRIACQTQTFEDIENIIENLKKIKEYFLTN